MLKFVVNPYLMQIAQAAQFMGTPNLHNDDRVIHIMAALKSLNDRGYARVSASSDHVKVHLARRAVSAMGLASTEQSLAARDLASKPSFMFRLSPSDDELDAHLQYSARYDQLLRNNEREIVAMFKQIGCLLKSVASGKARLIGPESSYGLVFGDEYADDHLSWYTFGKEPEAEANPIHLESIFLGCPIPHRMLHWPIERDEAMLQ